MESNRILELAGNLMTSPLKALGLKALLCGQSSGSPNSQPKDLWLTFSGNQNTDWKKVINTLIVLDPFKQSIQQSTDFLKSLGCNLDVLLLRKAMAGLEQILFCTVGQIALVDVIRDLEVTPSGFKGWSTGAIAANYARGNISREEALQVALIQSKHRLDGRCEEGTLQRIESIISADRVDPSDLMVKPGVDESKTNLSENCFVLELSANVSEQADCVSIIDSECTLKGTLNAIGRLFMEGYNPQIDVLYPKVQEPVPHMTRKISWDYHTDLIV